MEKKSIKLTVLQAKRLYSLYPKWRDSILSEFTDKELGIEKDSFKIWKKSFFENRTYYYVDSHSEIEEIEKLRVIGINDTSSNIVPSKKHAESMLAFSQLSILKDALGEECNVDWSEDIVKHTISRQGSELVTGTFFQIYEFLAFRSREVRDEFLETHEKLIKQYFMID